MRTMRQHGNWIAGFLLAGMAVLLVPALAHAHEFIIQPQLWRAYHQGQRVPFSVDSAHVFMVSEEMEPAELVQVTLDGQAVPLRANPEFLDYNGAVTLGGPGTAAILGHRLPARWSKTPRGWFEGGRDEHADAVYVGLFEKFCKALLPVDGTDGFDRIVGHDLEIVPLTNPFAGGDVVVQVLYQGHPLPVQVAATYDGFSDLSGTYCYLTEADADGRAVVRVDHDGLWMVRVQHKVAVQGLEYDERVLRSVLVFPVVR